MSDWEPQPLSRISGEFAAPTHGGLRSVWREGSLSHLDPASLAAILELACHGYPDRFFGLAEEMEERDLHYAAVLGVRKRALLGVEPVVTIKGTSKQAQYIQAHVKDLVSRPEFHGDYLTDLLDALGKGIAIVEAVWKRDERQWWPMRYEWRDPRHFQVDRIDGRTLRLKDETRKEGRELPPNLFSIHRPKLKSGLPVRGGLAMLAAWAFLFKHYTLKDWMSFLEVYGMPLRIGRYGRGAGHDDRRVLLQAVRKISTDAAAIIPKEMDIEFISAAGSTGGKGNGQSGLFASMVGYLDKQVSKGVLGQTMSTDDGSSQAQAEIHENVRHDIALADARQVAATINRALIRPFVDINFGPQERGDYPAIGFPLGEAEDAKVLSEAVRKLVPLGLNVAMKSVRQRLGFEAPAPGEKLLTAPRAVADVDASEETKALAAARATAAAVAAPEWVCLFAGTKVAELSPFLGRTWQVNEYELRLNFARQGGPLPIDWERNRARRANASSHAEAAAMPSTGTAGWIHDLEARGAQLWARVEWTDRAQQRIITREYAFLEPEWEHSPGLAIRQLTGASLVNRRRLVSTRPLLG